MFSNKKRGKNAEPKIGNWPPSTKLIKKTEKKNAEAIFGAAGAENFFTVHFLKENAPQARLFKKAEPKLGNWPPSTK